jgi:hypothetical protein
MRSRQVANGNNCISWLKRKKEREQIETETILNFVRTLRNIHSSLTLTRG